MADPAMLAEFPDEPQRYMVCRALRKVDEKAARTARRFDYAIKELEVVSAAADAPGGPAGRFKAILTATTLDRDGEVVVAEGVDTGEYQSNPVLLLMHDPQRPIGRCVSLSKRPNLLVGEFEVHDEEVWGRIRGGVLNTLSIGFIEKETRKPTARDLETFGKGVKRVLSKVLLIEVSLVAIPSNPDAVIIERGKQAPAVGGRTAETPAQTVDRVLGNVLDNVLAARQKAAGRIYFREP